MQKTISKFSYYYIATTLLIVGVIVKSFLVDTDLGARFKNFNHRLLASDILFLFAIFLALIGFIFNAIRNNRKTTLKDSTIIISAILIIPMSIVLALTPILETIHPGKVGDSALASWVMGLATVGTFAVFAWIILFIVILIKQTFQILTTKTEK
jgi:putative copper export protein